MSSGSLTSVYAHPRLPAGRRPRPDARGQHRHGAGRSCGRPAYRVVDPSSFDRHRFARPSNLYAAYSRLEEDGGDGAGIDGLTFEDFSEPEVKAALQQVSTALIDETYRPYPTREAPIPKGNGKSRMLLLQKLTDRTVAKALLMCLGGFWRRRLPGVGRDIWQVYALLEHAMHQRRDFILAIDDVRNCFPSAPLANVMNWHRRHISQQDLLWVIERIIRGHDGFDRLTGLDQGSPYSPVAMELLLHHCLDSELDARGIGNTLLLRYVDNLTFLCSSVSEGKEVLKIANEILARNSLCLKGEDGEPQDIRDPNYDRVVLGLIPRWQDGRLAPAIPESAFEHIQEGFKNANEHPRATKAARWVATGWIGAVGPALTTSVAPGVVDRVMDMAMHCGFREVSRRKLMETASDARQRWLKLREEIR